MKADNRRCADSGLTAARAQPRVQGDCSHTREDTMNMMHTAENHRVILVLAEGIRALSMFIDT